MTDETLVNEELPRAKTNIIVYLAFIIAIASAVATSYIYHSDREYRQQADIQIHALQANAIEDNYKNTEQITNLQDEVADLHTKLGELSRDKNSIAVFQVNELISLANQGLVVYGDVPTSIKLLSEAKDILQTNNDALFTGLKYALSLDLTRLNNLPKLDKVMLSGEIDAVLSGIATMHPNAPEPKSIGNQSTNEHISRLHKFFINIKNSLLSLVTITSANTKEVDALLPQEQIILVQSIRVNLLSARLALQQHDEANWVYSLNSADKILAEYFSSFSGVTEIRHTLATLLKEDVALPEANIDATLVQLTKLNNLQH